MTRVVRVFRGATERADLVLQVVVHRRIKITMLSTDSLANVPSGIFYGQLKREPYWEPLRQDSRYEKLLAELAPKD
jgi:hypothetical protein